VGQDVSEEKGVFLTVNSPHLRKRVSLTLRRIKLQFIPSRSPGLLASLGGDLAADTEEPSLVVKNLPRHRHAANGNASLHLCNLSKTRNQSPVIVKPNCLGYLIVLQL